MGRALRGELAAIEGDFIHYIPLDRAHIGELSQFFDAMTDILRLSESRKRKMWRISLTLFNKS